MENFTDLPSNSPYGAWTNLFFPFSSNENLKKQYTLLNLNKLRMGILLETLDCLA
jgi:hypothetical protein